MGDVIRRRLQQRQFDGPHHEAILALLLAGSRLREAIEGAFAGEDLTPAQYNVLRILDGVYPKGHPRGEIARRVIDRAPDLTRMIDRLVRNGLVERYRSTQDSRLSMTRITAKGRRLLARVRPRVNARQRELMRSLSAAEARRLSALLERVIDERG